MSGNVLVVIGAGGMGMAIARRCGKDSLVMLADIGEVSSALADEAYDVRTQPVDVSDPISVAALAKAAAELGPVQSVVHTAGLSPMQSPADRVIAVDLLGTAHVIDAFGPVIVAGGAAVVISSMAGHLTGGLPAADEAAIAAADAADLAALPCVRAAAAGDPGLAYAFAKAAVSALVRAAAQPWGRRGARINAISPGVIDTSMGKAELDGPSGGFMRTMVEVSGAGRLGTPDDIAAATEFLLSPNAAFITGADLLVDGGVVAAVRSGQLG